MSTEDKPLSELQVSSIIRNAFAQMRVRTVGELTRRTQLEFLAAAQDVARDDQKVAPLLVELSTALAMLRVTLAQDDLPTIERTVVDDGAPREGLVYIGSFTTGSTLALSEIRFAFRHGSTKVQRLAVEPGTWDVYDEGAGYRTKGVWLHHRGSGPASTLTASGLLAMPDPLLTIVDADAPRDRALLAHPKGVFEHGVRRVLAQGATYPWDAYASAMGAATRAIYVRATGQS
ncbi:MAG TPA: hypothetical protein VGM39_01220 [Kofleriaceae bacterium]|jgi:hypothetical protein